MSTKLEIKENDKGKFLEYKGVVLPFELKKEYISGGYDSFDMNPASTSGTTQTRCVFRVGEFETVLSFDSNDNELVEFYARECEESNKFEILMVFWVAVGGRQERVLGTVDM